METPQTSKSNRQLVFESSTLEERLAGLSSAEILATLKPDEILARLDAEQRLAGLDAKERLRLSRLLQKGMNAA